jgi:putative spermidine/putrescine transport system permease protein
VESRLARILIKAGVAFSLAFLYVPLAVVCIYAFNNSIGQTWPITSFTTKWFGQTLHNSDVHKALANSLKVATAATLLALLLGSAAAFAVHRFRFFGRNAVSLLVVLPIALPGIITGIALNSTINGFGLKFNLYTVMVGHGTFCIVVVYNNVVARLRRTSMSLVEASMDLGADGWKTFRYVTLPSIRTALVSGALLAFALSFDEIVVTNFTSGTEQTIPKFIFNSLRLPHSRPEVNVLAVVLILFSLIPVYFAQRVSGGSANVLRPSDVPNRV